MFADKLNQKADLRIFRILLLTLILLCTTNSYAQKSEIHKVEQATIVLKDGAKIYSTDEAFNKQVNNNIVVLKNADLTPQSKKSTKILEASSAKEEVIEKDFKQEVKNAAEEKRKKELRKVKKEVEKHEKRKEAFLNFDFEDFPSPSQFLSSNSSSKNYIAPSHNGNDFSKIYTIQKDYSVKRALDYLHAAKYILYNNKSLDFCYSQVYSVRPPPMLLG